MGRRRTAALSLLAGTNLHQTLPRIEGSWDVCMRAALEQHGGQLEVRLTLPDLVPLPLRLRKAAMTPLPYNYLHKEIRLVRDFDFTLPPELIAQAPSPERSGARLLCLTRGSGAMTHALVSELPQLLASGDVLVVNDTRVFPARLLGRRVPSGGAVECLLMQRVDPPATGIAGAPDAVNPTDRASSSVCR